MNPWERIQGELRKVLSPQNYSTWIEPARFSHAEGGVCFVTVPNRTFRDFIAQNYGPVLEQSLGAAAPEMDRIEFVDASAPSRKAAASRGTAAKYDGKSDQPSFDFDSPLALLNPRYTFDQFIVGPSNQFAHAAAVAVANSPSKAYNPLFLWGGVGMGKTHLLQAIAHGIASQRRLRLCYVNCNQFVHEMINSIKYDKMISFHDKYRNVDALLVDDIQFVSNKERTQEEFFHTFNALYESQKQIVFTSDRHPRDIPHLEERLRSRMEWGLAVDIQPPDLETKVAILLRKAEAQGITLDEDVAMMMASKIHGNVRELEGALTRLLAWSSLTGGEINLGTAQQLLKGTLQSQERRTTIEAIQQVVADEFRLKPTDLKAKDNSRKIVYPRQVAMYLCRELVGSSLPEIGRAFGGKHHTTVLHSVDKIQEARKSEKELNRLIIKLTDSLR
ncbi:MAG: chromosomal replication initiator protein DnaA [Acidobacteria bacterium]|nr:chromosomal replication initiator protein DnaA [Acidobacteriota bacterium]